MKNVFVTVDEEGNVTVPFKDDSINLVVVNIDRLEEYTFLYRGNEVTIDSINDDGTCTVIVEDDGHIVHDVPVEELDVIEGEDYLDF